MFSSSLTEDSLLCKLLLTGFPLHSESAIPTFGTVVCKTQESKSAWFRSGFSASFFCITPELYQTALFFLEA